ncbi:MAG: hypothetical protein JRE28_07775 [Deltaproteobacteria bacterium]|nr:hypothetical protein [Deltaproteobacteria bacterium]
MKRKHHGLISIVIIVVVLIPTAIYAVYSLQGPIRGQPFHSEGTSSEYTVPDMTVIKEISKLERKMMALANPIEAESVVDRSIRFWHYSDQHYPRYKTIDQGEQKLSLKAAYALTFTFASGKKKFCIIDGSFYPQGADLPDGGKILKIESGKVWVKKGELTTWISLPETAKWGKIQ